MFLLQPFLINQIEQLTRLKPIFLISAELFIQESLGIKAPGDIC